MLLREVTVRPLYARVATSNVGAIRAPEKCGYPEGCPTARTAPREVLADTSLDEQREPKGQVTS